jgi:antitoxin component YwqK of YwqJK toxin-antitoxin module
VWVITDKQRRNISRIEFTAGRRHGTATWWYPNGKRQHEIPYRDGIIDGTAIHYASDGKVASREVYQAGCRLSPETSKYADGKKKSSGTVLGPRQVVSTPDDWWNVRPAEFTSEGTDERHGQWDFWYPDGRKQFEGEYVHDVPTGKFTWWYPNGQVASSGKFQDGQQDGPWEWWHANGQKSIEGHFIAGAASGDWHSWREDGEPVRATDLAADKAQLAADNAPEPDDVASEIADAADPDFKEPEANEPEAETLDGPQSRRIKPKMEIAPPPIPRTKITITEIPGGVTLKFKAVEGTKRR